MGSRKCLDKYFWIFNLRIFLSLSVICYFNLDEGEFYKKWASSRICRGRTRGAHANNAENILTAYCLMFYSRSIYLDLRSLLLVNARHLGHLNALRCISSIKLCTAPERIPQSLPKCRKQTFLIHNYVILKTLVFTLGKASVHLNDCFAIPWGYIIFQIQREFVLLCV